MDFLRLKKINYLAIFLTVLMVSYANSQEKKRCICKLETHDEKTNFCTNNAYECQSYCYRKYPILYRAAWLNEDSTCGGFDGCSEYYNSHIKSNLNSVEKIEFKCSGKTYFLVKNLLQWSDHLCLGNDIGLNLADICTKEINDCFALQLRLNKIQDAYIGLNDVLEEGAWQWISGNNCEYRNWFENDEPNNSDQDPRGEDHAVINASGKWNDLMGYHYGHALPAVFQEK